MPQISVIVPAYKVEPYLHRCVDSILAQTFTDFELILVDDGSPDNCGVICDEYAAKDARIHVIHQENGGLSAARNAGIDWAFANSDSKWLSFIDSDDWVHPCFLEYLYRAVKENPVSVSACSFRKTGEYMLYPAPPFSARIMNWDSFYLQSPVTGTIACSKLYRKQLFEGLRYPFGKLHEDEFLTYRILDRAGTVAYVDAELYCYFMNPEGITRSGFTLKRLDRVEAMREQCAFLKKRGLKKLYENRLESRLTLLVREYASCRDCETIDREEKKRVLRKLRKEARGILLTKGRIAAPFATNKWKYEIAFPKIMWLYWMGLAVMKKGKRLLNR